jgi:hypothetical protein
MGALWRWARWLIALAGIGFWAWLFPGQAAMPPIEYSVPFEDRHGNWKDVLIRCKQAK